MKFIEGIVEDLINICGNDQAGRYRIGMYSARLDSRFKDISLYHDTGVNHLAIPAGAQLGVHFELTFVKSGLLQKKFSLSVFDPRFPQTFDVFTDHKFGRLVIEVLRK